jgi:hypothetical protein
MGSGGNLLKNIFSLAPGHEMLDYNRVPLPQEQKQQFLVDYYNQSVDNDTWLRREWSIRTGLYLRYYNNNIPAYWNPGHDMVYDNHGVLAPQDLSHHMRHYDRFKINSGEMSEQISTWSLQDCHHVFLLANNLNELAEIYNSKNPTIDQYLDRIPELQDRYQEFLIENYNYYQNILAVRAAVGAPHDLDYRELFADAGGHAIVQLATALGLAIDHDMINQLHRNWLQSTRSLYYNYHNRELKL